MKKAAIYARVSTTDQANKDTSIPTQMEMLKNYASNNNINIVKEYIDAGFSAYKDIESRKNFLEMIADAKSKPKPFDTIIYCYSDRVFRNMEDAVIYKSLLRNRCNIELICVTQDFDVTTANGQLMERLQDSLSEWDSASKGERIKAVMTNQSKKGIVLGEPPYGYGINEENNKFKIYEPEARIIKYIFNEYINGGSLRSIGVDLRTNGEKMFGKSALEKVSKAINNKGKHKSHKVTWRPTSIRNILTNRKYIGEYEWDEKIITSNHPLIIDEDKFILANKILSKKSTVRSDSPDYLLKDLVFCYECGGSLSQLNQKYKLKSTGELKIYTSLRCSNHVRMNNCYTNMQKMDLIEDNLKGHIKEVIDNPYKYKLNIQNNGNIKKLNKLQNKLKDFDKQFDRQMEAYQSGVIELEQLKKYKDKTQRDKANLINQVNQLEELENNYNKKLNDLIGRLKKVYEILIDENLPLQTKKNALLTVIHKIMVSKRENFIRIIFVY